MVKIEVLFFMLSSFLSVNESQIAANDIHVSINPAEKVVTIKQYDLFTVFIPEQDTLAVITEIKKVLHNKEQNWNKALDNFEQKSCVFQKLDNQINANITLRYKNEKDLEAMGIWYNQELGEFSMLAIPEENLTSKNGRHKDKLIVFQNDSTFSFKMNPFKKMREEHKKLKKSLLLYWDD